MNLIARTLIAGTALTIASSASATISIAAIVPGSSTYTGPAPTFDFDTSTPAFSGGAVVTGTSSSHAQPLGSTGNYYAVGPSDTSPGTLTITTTGGLNGLSLIWGSVDYYNTLEFLDGANNVLATFVGNDIFNPANGDQTAPNTNPVVYFSLTGSDVDNFRALRLTSNINAFEIDNIATAPEPATWAMMLLGFGAIGLSMRRGRKALPQLA